VKLSSRSTAGAHGSEIGRKRSQRARPSRALPVRRESQKSSALPCRQVPPGATRSTRCLTSRGTWSTVQSLAGALATHPARPRPEGGGLRPPFPNFGQTINGKDIAEHAVMLAAILVMVIGTAANRLNTNNALRQSPVRSNRVDSAAAT